MQLHYCYIRTLYNVFTSFCLPGRRRCFKRCSTSGGGWGGGCAAGTSFGELSLSPRRSRRKRLFPCPRFLTSQPLPLYVLTDNRRQVSKSCFVFPRATASGSWFPHRNATLHAVRSCEDVFCDQNDNLLSYAKKDPVSARIDLAVHGALTAQLIHESSVGCASVYIIG
jgi:hypothetical protein